KTKSQKAIRILVIGDEDVGKTCFTESFLKKKYSKKAPGSIDDAVHTVDIDELPYDLTFSEFNTRKLSPQEQKKVYSGVNVVLVCYSTVDKNSFEYCEKLMKQTWDIVDNTPILLVGLKKDRRDQRKGKQFVNVQDAEKLASSYGCKNLDCSAKTMQGVNQVFEVAIHEYYKETLKNSGAQCKCVIM
ncbi:Ras-related protein Rac, partial [Acrasis kona]